MGNLKQINRPFSPAGRRSRGGVRRQLVSYAFLAPWLVVFLLFTVIPVLAAVVMGFTSFDILRPPQLVGLDNYIRLFLEDDVFLTALKNTLLLALVTGPAGYLLSFVLAWLISDLGPKSRSFMTLVFYAPALSGNIYYIWQFIFSDDSAGFINSLLIRMNFIKDPVYWLTDTKYNLIVCAVVILWTSMGAGFLSFVAGSMQLDRSLYEAGAIDGIRNRWQELWYVTLPQMGPQLLIGAVLGISGAFAVGYQNAAMTGFPSTDYSTHTLVLHILDYGSIRFELGYACAIAVVLFALMALAWSGINRFLRVFVSNS
jgi:multiple sugar transport system permease protein